jgi:uncharacterized protein YneF (UPF0154 family)
MMSELVLRFAVLFGLLLYALVVGVFIGRRSVRKDVPQVDDGAVRDLQSRMVRRAKLGGEG